MKSIVTALFILIATTGIAQSLKGFTLGEKVNENEEWFTTVGGVPGMIIPQTNVNEIIYSLFFVPIDEQQTDKVTIVFNRNVSSDIIWQFKEDVRNHYQIKFNEMTENGIKRYWAIKNNAYYLLAVPEDISSATASFVFSISDLSSTRAKSSDF